MKLLPSLCLYAIAQAKVYFQETFDNSWTDRWVPSEDPKFTGKWGLSAGEWYADAEESKGLQTTQDAKFYAISSAIPTPFSNAGNDLVIQFTVKHGQTIDCGGGYIKLLPEGLDQSKFNGDSAYNIMFGPDICGYTKKVHAIFNYDGKNLERKDTIPAESDEFTHAYTLIVRPDNTYEVRVDGQKKASGSLESDWDFLPPRKIKDPAVSKPSDWVDSPKMDDPNDVKPEGYDDIPKEIPDPDAEKPADWDDEDDGEWEAPLISNPDYKGPWVPKRIDNPAYKGPWVHPEIDNPSFKEDPNLYKYDSFGFVGIDLWQVKSGSIFDNIFIGDNVAEAEAFLEKTFTAGKSLEKKMYDDRQAKKKADEEASKSEEDTTDEPEGKDEL